MEKYDLILSAEEQFAREVTLGAIVARPPSAWFYLIPGMFIIDYLRRGSAIRKYTQHFMFPRKLAVDAARAVSQGEDEASVRSHVEKDTGAWLSALNLYSEELLKAHLAFTDVLIEHYSALLKAEGDSYYLLVGAAYPEPGEITNSFWKRLPLPRMKWIDRSSNDWVTMRESKTKY